MKSIIFTSFILSLITLNTKELKAEIAENPICPKVKSSKPFRSKHVKQMYPQYYMGTPSADHQVRTKKFKISYHANGLEFRNQCKANERLEFVDNYIDSLVTKYPGIYPSSPNPLLEEYRAHAYKMLLTPRAFGDAIDRCFAATVKRWNQCGGKYAKTSKEMKKNVKKLRVQVMPAAFFVKGSTGGNLFVAGLADIDGKSIFAMTSAIHGNSTGSPYINTFENLVCWEMGNTFSMNMGYFANSLKQEIGFQSPCKFRKK